MANRILDVSSNNGNIDWNEVVNDGVTDVVIRLSLGYGTKDTKSESYAKDAASVGIRVSYYHFAYPDKKPGTLQADAKQEANYFTSLFQAGQMPLPNWLAVDLEKWENDRDSPLNKTEYLDWLITFLAEVHAVTGAMCLIYSNKSYLDTHLPTNHQLGTMPLWIANYNNVSQPPLPVGWSQYFLWQYTESGIVKGLSKPCDLSKTYQSLFFEKQIAKVNKRRSMLNT